MVLGILLLLGAAVGAEAAARKPRPRKPVLVRDVYVEIRNIFDPNVPGENIWLFRMANRLHIKTRASVIRQELLMEPGTKSDSGQIDESERSLRALPFIKDASITQTPNADGTVDLTVRTQDSWTTQPQFNISSEGGQTTYSAGFEEINLLGYGKDFSYFYRKDSEGISHLLGYSDPQFMNTRLRLNTSFQDIPTGSVQSVNLDHPFYALTTPWAAGITSDHYQQREKVFQNGVEISRYDREHLGIRPYGGLWVNKDPMNAVRMTLTYRYTEDVYRDEALTKVGTLPSNQALSGPILGASFFQSDFIKETFADRAGRVEDINLGHVANVGLGYVGRSFGATENSLPFSYNHAFGFGGEGEWFGLASYGSSSRYTLYKSGQTGGRLFNTVYYADFNAYRHLMRDFPMTGVFHAESAYLQNPDADNVLALGGNAGLRGFKNDAQTGNKSLLCNLENRFFYPREVFHLAYVGGAVFVDAGQVQPQGQGFRTKDMRANIGVGMRFGLSRSAEGTVFRVDLAYAVGPIQQSNRWILSISSAQGFKRTANTYGKFTAYSATQ